MYVVAVYDVATKRTGKMLKLCRQYLHWVQNSVFEGELTQVQLKALIQESKVIMDESYDSFIIFQSRQSSWMEKQIIGREKGSNNQFL